LTGVVEVFGLADPLDNDHLQPSTETINLNVLHPVEMHNPAPVPPDRAVAKAAVGVASMNNDDSADEWTFAVDRVETRFDGASLMLVVDIAAQGGPDGLVGFVGTVIAKLAYHVTVVVT
jgi:hypothetical protein